VLLSAERLPTDAKALLSLLGQCGHEIQRLIDDGQMLYIYQPTMLGKDIGLALESHLADLTNQRRVTALVAIRRLVIVAWRLDLAGDLGNLILVRDAFREFAAAIADLERAYDIR
jgi:hypothetical protein